LKILTNLDLNKNQLTNASIQNLAVAPDITKSVIGQIYYNTTDKIAYIFDGTVWCKMSTASGQTEFTQTYKDKLDGIQAGAQVNQNAFTTIKVGTTDVVADQATDTLVLSAGTNVVLTPNATTDTIQIGLSPNVETTTGAQNKANSALASANTYTDNAITNLLGSAPDALNTLNELATALGNDANFATTMTTELSKRAKKYSANIGDAVAKEFTIQHNLDTKDLSVSLEEIATGEVVYADILKVDTNNIKLMFAVAPSANQFRATIIG
jgi:hypothetical protein